MLNHLLNIAAGLGNLLDTPGSMLRDTLALQNPFDQLANPFSSANRLSGRDLLRHYGLAGQHDNWGNFAGGLATEIATDPLNLVGSFLVRNAARVSHAAQAENSVIRAANAKSLAQRSAGYMPAEIAAQTAIRGENGLPKRMYHGTNAVFENFDSAMDAGNNNYGRGFYHTDHPSVASTYAPKEGRTIAGEVSPQNVRMAYMDIRNPLDMRARYGGDSLPSPVADMLRRDSRQRIRDEVAQARWLKSRASSPLAQAELVGVNKEIASRFASRHSIPDVTGEQVYRKISKNSVADFGFDGILHEGELNPAGKSHEVAIALDPSQVYKPYIADPIRQELKVPRVTPKALGLAAYAPAARLRRPEQ